jgi:hypothetical protein
MNWKLDGIHLEGKKEILGRVKSWIKETSMWKGEWQTIGGNSPLRTEDREGGRLFLHDSPIDTI